VTILTLLSRLPSSSATSSVLALFSSGGSPWLGFRRGWFEKGDDEARFKKGLVFGFDCRGLLAPVALKDMLDLWPRSCLWNKATVHRQGGRKNAM